MREWVNQFQTSQKESGDDTEKSLADKWAEEMSGGATKPANGDFWDVLEKQWDDMAKYGRNYQQCLIIESMK